VPDAGQQAATTPIRFLRLADVCHLTGLARSSVYEHMAAGTFPKPVPLSARAVGWIEHEIAAWQLDRISARNRKRTRT
jgi:prophage regulatory protein